MKEMQESKNMKRNGCGGRGVCGGDAAEGLCGGGGWGVGGGCGGGRNNMKNIEIT